MKFKVLHNLRYDNNDYKPGSIVEMSEDVAASLVEDGIIEKVVEQVATPPPSDTTDNKGNGDDEDEKILQEILEKEPDELTEEEVTILKNAELSEEDKEKFASVLEE